MDGGAMPQRPTRRLADALSASVSSAASSPSAAPPVAADEGQADDAYDRRRLVQLCYDMAAARGAGEQFAAAFSDHGLCGEAASVLPRTLAVSSAAVPAFADHLLYNLFLPLRAAAHCGSVVPLEEGRGHRGPRDDTLVRLHVFPPSPMTRLEDDGSQSESGMLAASLLALLNPRSPALLQQLQAANASREGASRHTVVVDRAWAAPFSRFAAVVAGGLDDGETAAPPNDNTNDENASSQPPLLPLPRIPVHEPITAAATLALVSLHADIARVLHASGAGAYVDRILADTAVEDLRAAGNMAHLGHLMALRLGGWWDGGRSRQQTQQFDPEQPDFWIETATLTEEQERRSEGCASAE